MSENTVKSGEGYTEDAEFRFIGSLFGAVVAFAGLLAGTMVRERSLDYWLDDIMPLLLLAFTLRGVIKSSLDLAKDSIYYEEQRKQVVAALKKQEEMLATMSAAEADIPKLTAKSKTSFSEEEVLEAVSKRIEQNRDEAIKKNKLVN